MVVVNTSTVAPGEASQLARQLGPSYVHAPVLGSVPAAAAGFLQVLAGAVLALRDSLRQADALGLPRDQVLEFLELGQLGGLVAGKRAFLTGRATAAEFTIGALAKDMALLAAASDTPLPSAAELADSPAGPEADIALAATVPAVGEATLEPLRAYIRGHATGDSAHFRDAFLPNEAYHRGDRSR
jgi:3-hydroxyisobutyrate dehydrogenase-like beta-hydroxyacid dehydrogenase